MVCTRNEKIYGGPRFVKTTESAYVLIVFIYNTGDGRPSARSKFKVTYLEKAQV